MINQVEIPLYLEKAIPEISAELKSQNKEDVHEQIQALTSFTDKNIRAHNYDEVARCLRTAELLYSKGNAAVKNAVENVFVYSFTRLFSNNPAEKQRLIGIIPMTLYSLYMAQVYHRGC
jgi:hypothetical protein